ncbi:MAG: hypothetical protein KU37_05980 [Sulfuricurvum sp. PC08-66]|nr:MAG: hypothetical protein KU37_05980 [Sulfuricurvum sp. PC08-66]
MIFGKTQERIIILDSYDFNSKILGKVFMFRFFDDAKNTYRNTYNITFDKEAGKNLNILLEQLLLFETANEYRKTILLSNIKEGHFGIDFNQWEHRTWKKLKIVYNNNHDAGFFEEDEALTMRITKNEVSSLKNVLNFTHSYQQEQSLSIGNNKLFVW